MFILIYKLIRKSLKINTKILQRKKKTNSEFVDIQLILYIAADVTICMTEKHNNAIHNSNTVPANNIIT